jgi:hypothetical protein
VREPLGHRGLDEWCDDAGLAFLVRRFQATGDQAFADGDVFDLALAKVLLERAVGDCLDRSHLSPHVAQQQKSQHGKHHVGDVEAGLLVHDPSCADRRACNLAGSTLRLIGGLTLRSVNGATRTAAHDGGDPKQLGQCALRKRRGNVGWALSEMEAAGSIWTRSGFL